MAACAGTLLSASGAHASRVWALAEFGTGYVVGPYHFEGEANPVFGGSGLLEFDATVQSPTIGLPGALGYSMPAGLALGVGADLVIIPLPDVVLAETDLSVGYVTAFSAVAGFHPSESGLSLRFGVGFAQSAFAYGKNDISSPDNIVEPEVVTGPIGSLGVGWLWSGVGVGGRISYARLSGDQSSFDPLILSVGLLLETW